jgi:hypothetical protein
VGGAGPHSPRQSLIFNICKQALALILEEGRRVGEGLDPHHQGAGSDPGGRKEGGGGAGPHSPRQSLIFNICEQALALILEEGRRVWEGLDPPRQGRA